MKTLLCTLSFCLLLICSCNNSTKNEKLYIKTIDITGVDEKEVKKETISEVTSDYFEVSLSAYDHFNYYKGERDLVAPTSIENFKSVFFTIIDKNGNDIQFKESTEFLNFMSTHGYEMVDQIKNEYGGDYTFKKKIK